MTKSGGGKTDYDVFIQSNTSNLFRAFLQTYVKEDIKLTSNIEIDDSVINVSSGHGITGGQFVIIYTSDYYWQTEVKSVTDDAVTLYAPSYLPFPVEDTTIIRGSVDMNVDGSETPVTYKFGIPCSNIDPIDINSGIILLGHSADGGDDLYGGITALTEGFLIRKIDSTFYNLGNYRENRDFKLFGAKVNPVDKPPAGIYGTEIKFLLQGQENFDQVLRIKYGDYITGLVRDDLSPLTYKRFSILGSYTSGE
jgi:hypothetical protein